MAAPSIIIGNGQVLLTMSSSSLGIYTSPDGEALSFGTIEAVSDLSDSAVVGQTCSFDIKKTKSFAYGSTIYYLLNEKDLNFTEVAIP